MSINNTTYVQDKTEILAAENAIGRLSAKEQAGVMQRAMRGLPSSEERRDLIVQAVRDLPLEEQAATIRAARIAAPGFKEPSDVVRDQLWLIVIVAFAIVLVGSFFTLAISVFVAPSAGGTSGQVILTLFTTVVGFLAGLFTPSPVSTTQTASNNAGS